MMPSAAPYPAKPDQSDSAASMLIPLVNQFGLMQQQMFDQFQQAMAMMVQMFGTMHRDQMEVIRTELDRLHELTAELQSLKDELARRTQAQPEPISGERAGNPAVFNRSESPRRDIPTGFSPAQMPPFQLQPTAAHRPAANSGAIQTGSWPSSPLPSTSADHGDTLSEKAHLSGPQIVRLKKTPRHLRRNISNPPALVPSSDPLNQMPEPSQTKTRSSGSISCIMSIQSEREGRWQKILKLLPGIS